MGSMTICVYALATLIPKITSIYQKSSALFTRNNLLNDISSSTHQFHLHIQIVPLFDEKIGIPVVYLRIENCDEIVRVLSWKFDISLKITTTGSSLLVSGNIVI